MPSATPETSSSSICSTRPVHLRQPTESDYGSRRRPLSWSARVKDSFFRSDAKAKRGAYSRGRDGPHDRSQSGPLKSSLFSHKRAKGKRRIVTIEELKKDDPGGFISDAGTVQRTADFEMPLNVDHFKRPAGSWPGHPRHNRTVSHEDYLTSRGANPRTGIVSPSISSHSGLSESFGPRVDHAHLGHTKLDKKWRLKGDQWISLDKDAQTPPATPSSGKPTDVEDKARSYIRDLQQRGVRRSQVDDRFVVNMPSAREPNPPTMTTQQIADFQQAIDRIHNKGENFLDPNLPLTPPEVTPEGPSTPPRRLTKMPPGDIMARSAAKHAHVRTQPEARSHPAPTPGRRHFLGDSRAKGTNIRRPDPFPSPPIIPEHSRIRSGSLLERRGRDSLSLNSPDLDHPLFPQVTPWEDAFTTTTTMTNATPYETQTCQDTSVARGKNQNLLESNLEQCVSAFLKSLNGPTTALVGVDHQKHATDTLKSQFHGQTTQDMSILTLPSAQSNVCSLHGVHCPFDDGVCFYVCNSLRYACTILIACLKLISDGTSRNSSTGPRSLSDMRSPSQPWTGLILLAFAAYAIWKPLAYIITFGMENKWIAYTGGLYWLAKWLAQPKYDCSINP